MIFVNCIDGGDGGSNVGAECDGTEPYKHFLNSNFLNFHFQPFGVFCRSAFDLAVEF